MDVPALEDEDCGVALEEDAVPPEAGVCKIVRRALREDLLRPLARAGPELGDDGQTLVPLVLGHHLESIRASIAE